MEDLAFDRPTLEHAALGRVELVEPRGEQRLDRRRHRDVAAAVGHHRDHLLDEERVAARGLENAAAQLVVDPAGQGLDQLDRVLRTERLEQDVGRVQLAAAPGRTGIEQLRPGHADEQDRRVPAQIGHVLDEVEEGGLAPVDVVEDDHDRLLGSAGLQQLAESPGDLLATSSPPSRRRGSSARGPDCASVRDELLHDLGPPASS